MGKFFTGVLTGIILAVAIICGCGYYFIAEVPVSQYEEWTGTDVTPGEDPANNTSKSILEYGQFILNFSNNIDSKTVEDLKDNFGLDLSSYLNFDLSSIKDIPISEIPNNVDKLVEKFSIENVENMLNFKFPDMPIFNDKSQSALTAINNLSKIANPDTLTLAKLKDNFGIELTDMKMLEELKEIPINNLPDEIQNLKVEKIIDINRDLFIDRNVQYLEEKIEEYNVNIEEHKGKTRYNNIDGAFVEAEDGMYVKVYSYKSYNPIQNLPSNQLYLKLYVSDGNNLAPRRVEYMPIEGNIFTDSNKINQASGADIINYTLALYNNNGEKISVPYNYNASLKEMEKAETDNNNYYLYSKGSAITLLQKIADAKVSSLSNDMQTLVNQSKLNEILTIDSESPLILKSLANSSISEISNKINYLKLNEIIEINDSSSNILKSLKNQTLLTLPSKLNSLQLKEIIEIKENDTGIMAQLKDSTMQTISVDAQNLIKDASLGDLESWGVITGVDTNSDEWKAIETKTISQIINLYLGSSKKVG